MDQQATPVKCPHLNLFLTCDSAWRAGSAMFRTKDGCGPAGGRRRSWCKYCQKGFPIVSEPGEDDAPGQRPDGAQLLRLTDYGGIGMARILTDLRDYWQSLRRGRAVPARADVEPHGISRALDYAFVLERIAPGAARFRLAGRHLIDLMGMEVRDAKNGAVLGKIADVLTLPANNVYVVRGGEREWMIPAVPEFVAEVNIDEDYMRVNLMEGL